MIEHREAVSEAQYWRTRRDNSPILIRPEEITNIEAPKSPEKPSIPNRFRNRFRRKFRLLPLQFVRWLMPELGVSGYCVYCWARLELVDSQSIEEDFHATRGVHFWKCPEVKIALASSTPPYAISTSCGDTV